jgi:hypothetical protein
MADLLAVDESLGLDRNELLQDVEGDRNIVQALHEAPRGTFRSLNKMLAEREDPANT